MRIFRYIAFVALLSLAVAVRGEEYCYPIRGVKGLYSASYGEMRPNHFHSGVDIRTEGAEGKAVVAVADGYVSRISVAPTGYGLALYVTHPKEGTVSVYAHLSRLCKKLADTLVEARYERKLNRINLFPSEGAFPVSQGDTIAFSGNSGSSFGPHLHFEMRDLRSGHTLNPVRQGVVAPQDTIPPTILRLHYVVADTLMGRPKSRMIGSYTPKFDDGEYRITEGVEVCGRGYFVVEALDRRNGSSNRFGLYGAKMWVDGEEHFDYRIDRFAFVDTRHCNIVSYYPLQRTAKCEALCLAKMPLAPPYLYPYSPTDGFMALQEGEMADVGIEIADECGNISKLRFEAHGAPYFGRPMAKLAYDAVCVDSETTQEVAGEGFSLFVPRKALYEAEYCRTSAVEKVEIKDSTLVQLSPFYRIFTEDTAFNKAVKARFGLSDTHLVRGACVATIDDDGRAKYLGGEYRGDSVEVVFRRGGTMVVVADTIAPMIRPRFRERADMRGVAKMSFAVKDNFSKVRSYALYIDDEWRSVEYQPKKGEMTHHFDMPLRGRGLWRKVRLEVEDCCGNKGVWQGKILK